MKQKTPPHRTGTQAARDHRAQLRQIALQKAARRKRWRLLTIILVVIVAVSAVVFGIWSARPTTSGNSGSSDSTASTAPDFTLSTTAGQSVTLSKLRGHPVILYYNEGAGCGACTAQMAAIEKNPGFKKAGITVLPIVMNTAEQIEPDLKEYGVTTPYLLDNGSVSEAYHTLGKGMHENLPGHAFILIDSHGVKRWSGEYPSMWLDPADLLKEANSRL